MTPDELTRLLAAFPTTPLGHLPTPIDAMPRLGEKLGVNILVKRDDATGLAFGGNKVRQLEYYFGKALAAKADTVLITGAVQSNYVRTTAAAAAKLGLRCHVQLEDRVPLHDKSYVSSGNALLNKLLGAIVHTYPDGEDEAGADARLYEIADEERRKGHTPYVIPLGPGNPPTGALGYVSCALELAGQLDAMDPVDAFVVPSGSGMTHGGFLVGMRSLGVTAPVHGICVRRAADLQADRILANCTAIEELIGAPSLVAAEDVHTIDAALGLGYGRLNDGTYEAVLMAARLEGLLLDTVYTGRTMAGLIHLANEGMLAPGSTVLFLHTGGTPALFGYSEVLNERLGVEVPAQ
ncbi:MAG: D-cysteine desulfhydrase family protein [Alphaproteobacteria bacterium]|nr:D-cysteine desulfhydrase family protein [Alphaproteobacteria bacterium]